MNYPVCPRCGNREKRDPVTGEIIYLITGEPDRWGVTEITDASGTHYICNNPRCGNNYIYEDEELNPEPHPADPGQRTQFKVIEDTVIRFPFNQIFVGRGKNEFFRKEYVE